jgi:hypothetical protein
VCVCVCVRVRVCACVCDLLIDYGIYMVGCVCIITATSETPSTEGRKSKRQQLQQQHFGQRRGHKPSMPMLSVLFYIADIMHNIPRVVPLTFLNTTQENCDEE